ncbi:hypothetical protein BKA80DRAFT_143851 [Phyllosticta citrichinensis]
MSLKCQRRSVVKRDLRRALGVSGYAICCFGRLGLRLRGCCGLGVSQLPQVAILEGLFVVFPRRFWRSLLWSKMLELADMLGVMCFPNLFGSLTSLRRPSYWSFVSKPEPEFDAQFLNRWRPHSLQPRRIHPSSIAVSSTLVAGSSDCHGPRSTDKPGTCFPNYKNSIGAIVVPVE